MFAETFLVDMMNIANHAVAEYSCWIAKVRESRKIAIKDKKTKAEIDDLWASYVQSKAELEGFVKALKTFAPEKYKAGRAVMLYLAIKESQVAGSPHMKANESAELNGFKYG